MIASLFGTVKISIQISGGHLWHTTAAFVTCGKTTI